VGYLTQGGAQYAYRVDMSTGVDTRDRPGSIRHPPPTWVTFEATFFVTISTQIRGVDLLCVSEIAGKLRAATDVYDARESWHTLAGVVMPDHVHLLVRVPKAGDLLPLVTAWKRYTARTYRVRWQRGFFEHRLRKDDSVAAKHRLHPPEPGRRRPRETP
jgi:putative transposase